MMVVVVTGWQLMSSVKKKKKKPNRTERMECTQSVICYLVHRNAKFPVLAFVTAKVRRFL